MKVFLAILVIPSLAISLFITHELLEAINADRLLWFIYWINVPTAIILGVMSRLIEKNNKD